MGRHRFSGLRRWLSYANVMATLALFFALSGSAMAGVKYLTASDPITSGDLAGSTYGTPVIAAGQVTSAKIADGAITSSKFAASATAPNATELAGHASTDFPLVVARGSVTFSGFDLTPGGCISTTSVDIPSLTTSDVAIADGTDITVSDLSVTAVFSHDDATLQPDLEITVCNVTSGDTSPAGTYNYIVLR
jgi:hypothetical protein